MRRSWKKFLIGGVVFGLLLAACTAGNDTAETFSEIASGLGDGAFESPEIAAQTDAMEAGDEGEDAAEDPSDDDLGTGGILTASVQPVDYGRDIIFTADLTVAVNDVAAAGEEATRIIQSMGGFLFGQQTVGSPEPRSTLTFKVPPGQFQEALAALGSVGEIRSQNVSASDVTERIVDLESRINTAEASVERLRALLAEATDIKAIVELENELLTRESELESLRGQLRTLEDQVALATIVVTLTEARSMPGIAVNVTAYPAHDDGLSCPGSPSLEIEQGMEGTVCYEIVNTGDTWLADFELRDPILDLELDDLLVVFGDPSSSLEPGEAMILAAEVTPERSIRTQTTVTAQPVDENGETLPDRPASSTVGLHIVAVDPGGVPTFSEGLEASWELLRSLGQLLVLFVGALLPFIWVPLVIVVMWRFFRRREQRTSGSV